MNTTSEILIDAIELQKSFRIGDRTINVLRGVDFTIHRGEVIFLVGASGAGKTTLLHSLAGLERPDTGRIRFQDRDIYALSDGTRARLRNRHMGFVFQSYYLLPELTALENVMIPRRIVGTIDPSAAKAALARVGLAERIHHLPSELSGGEQQRVAIARALINDPDVLFADEPTGNLDSQTGSEVVDLLLGIAREAGKTLVVITHDPALAERGTRRVQMRDGRVVSG